MNEQLVRPYYFVRHLQVGDARRADGCVAQIQLVDQYGLGIAFAYVGEHDRTAMLSGNPVPSAVVLSAFAQAPGTGRFVDALGREVAPRELS